RAGAVLEGGQGWAAAAAAFDFEVRTVPLRGRRYSLLCDGAHVLSDYGSIRCAEAGDARQRWTMLRMCAGAG
ncbi:MAG: hypothetical protein ACO3ZK_15125, partial [Rubrivivax sp.]